uniref:ARAD1D21692p n=1 Tax=Blastobotrys adeninivorans TaxID=409370 RepID=A0A060TA86_BLAAD
MLRVRQASAMNMVARHLRQCRGYATKSAPKLLNISPEVQRALDDRSPIVALESTIITHGLPYPDNLEMATQVEEEIRKEGAVPATMAFIDGIPQVGLNEEQILKLSALQKGVKISRRDIGHVVAKKLSGGTTIAGTMILAHMAGIQVFATGGLGGVHREGEITMDVSADLDELARTPVSVVCSGPKSILDIGRTMEYLETKGVPVSTYGEPGTNVPGFFTSDSGVPSPYNFDDPRQAAAVILASEAMKLKSGNVFCVPTPKDLEIPKEHIDSIIEKALKSAKDQNITGKEVTPFLLSQIWEATGGQSLKTNVGFVKNNASMAAQIAVALAKLKSTSIPSGKAHRDKPTSTRPTPAMNHFLGPSLGVTKSLLAQVEDVSETELEDEANREAVKESETEQDEFVKLVEEEEMELDEDEEGELEDTTEKQGGYDPSDLFTPKTRKLNRPKMLPPPVPEPQDKVDAMVVGGLAVDSTCHLSSSENIIHTSTPGIVYSSTGGVGHNIALASTYSGARRKILTRLVSQVGSDGQAVLDKIKVENPYFDTTGILINKDARTAKYIAIHDSKGELQMACADMEDLENLSCDHIQKELERGQPMAVFFDGNIGPEQMATTIKYTKVEGRGRQDIGDPIIGFEPTSVTKARKLAQVPNLQVWPKPSVDLATPNIYELKALHDSFEEAGLFEDRANYYPIWKKLDLDSGRFDSSLKNFCRANPQVGDIIDSKTVAHAIRLLPYIPYLFVKMGSRGVLAVHLVFNVKKGRAFINAPLQTYSGDPIEGFVHGNPEWGVLVQHYPALRVKEGNIRNVNGCGDTLTGMLLNELGRDRGWLKNVAKRKRRIMNIALAGAAFTLQSDMAVNPEIMNFSEKYATRTMSLDLD